MKPNSYEIRSAHKHQGALVEIDPQDEGLDVVALQFHIREVDLSTLDLTDEQYEALFEEDVA